MCKTFFEDINRVTNGMALLDATDVAKSNWNELLESI